MNYRKKTIDYKKEVCQKIFSLLPEVVFLCLFVVHVDGTGRLGTHRGNCMQVLIILARWEKTIGRLLVSCAC
jgi:hypothetical protein